jgi:uncharacterized membrane protein YdjX (TVP38/TMEM64 family)
LRAEKKNALKKSNMADFHKKVFVIFIIAILTVLVLEISNYGDDILLDSIQNKAVELKKQVNSHYLSGIFIFVFVYAVVNVFLPAAAVLTLLGGFLYGTVPAVIYVDVAATLGALLAFGISRNFTGGWIQRRWHEQLTGFNEEVSKRGYVYLLLVRLIPMVPYILVNFFAGLTKVRLRTFAWTTAVGSLPGIFIFSYAGHQLLNMTSVEQIFTPRVITALALLVAFIGLIGVIELIMKKNKKRASEGCQ